MSYILKALDKSKTNKPAETDYQAAAQAPVSVITNTNHSIAWGVLLTLAIFLALLVGFFLGKNSHLPSSDFVTVTKKEVSEEVTRTKKQEALAKLPDLESQVTEIKVAPLEIQQEPLREVDTKKAATIEKKYAVTQAKENKTAVKPIVAESYFESPPAKPERKREKISHTVAKQTQPLKNKVQSNIQPQEQASQQSESNDLLERFLLAVEDTADDSPDDLSHADQLVSDFQQAVKPLSKMPQWLQNEIPRLQFDIHMYSSEGDNWVKVNGHERRENQLIAPNLVLKKISLNNVIMTYKGQVFSLPALTNW